MKNFNNTPVKNIKIADSTLFDKSYYVHYDLSFDDAEDAEFYYFEIGYPSDNKATYSMSVNNKYPITLFYGQTAEITISPIFVNGFAFKIGEPNTIKFITKASPWSEEIANQNNVKCFPSKCDTSNLEKIVYSNGGYLEIPYLQDRSQECEVYYFKVNTIANPSVFIDFHLSIIREKNGGYKIYYRDELCNKASKISIDKGQGYYSIYFDQNNYFNLNVYNTLFSVHFYKDVSVKWKKVG